MLDSGGAQELQDIQVPTVPSAATVALAFLAGSPGRAEGPATPGVEIERREQFSTLAPGTTVFVSNDFGDVRARFGGYDGVVEVRAVLQQFASEGPRLEVELVASAAGLQVTVGDRPAGAKTLRTERQPGQKKRADLVLFVPKGVHLAVATTDGEIQARGLRSDLRARSLSGAIEARSIRGDLDLASASGAIFAAPESLDRRTVQRFASESGNITLRLAEQGHFSCSAATRGRLSTDFTLTIEDDPAEPAGKRALATIGKGTTPLEVRSRVGHLRLKRRPSAEEARRPAPASPQLSSRAALLLALALAPLAAITAVAAVPAVAAVAPIPQSTSASTSPERPPDLLWELPATAPCRLSLVHLDGAVEVVVGGTGARLLGEARRWQVAVAEPGGPADSQLRLTVGRGTAADDTGAAPGAGTSPDLAAGPPRGSGRVRSRHPDRRGSRRSARFAPRPAGGRDCDRGRHALGPAVRRACRGARDLGRDHG